MGARITVLLGLGVAGLSAGLLWWPVEPAPAQPQGASVGAGAALPAALAIPRLDDAAEIGPHGTPTSAAGSAAASTATPSPQQALQRLKRCYFANSCGFPETDSRSAHFAAAHAIVAQLRALPQQGSPIELGALAREFLTFPDGHVQAEALRLAARLPPDAATLGSVIAALADSHDAVLFKQALPVLDQWQQLGLRAGLDDLMLGTLRTGGLFAAQAVAENLLPFVNEANRAQYQALVVELPEGARRQALQQSLREYHLQRSGG